MKRKSNSGQDEGEESRLLGDTFVVELNRALAGVKYQLE